MTFLKPTTCEQLSKLGVRQEIITFEELITDSEAMKLVFGEDEMSNGFYEGVTYLNGGSTFKEVFRPAYEQKAHQLLDLLLSGDYEAAEQLLVEALERVK